MRVRFAPSPTGPLHVGGARTALMNWLLARHGGGSFVLRIEDTDLARSSAAFESAILDDLRWLGFSWDEGPDIGGPFGPYRQSERLEGYRAAAHRLLDGGRAFLCYCTDEELEERRGRARAEGRPPHYDGACRDLDAAGRRAREAGGRRGAIRFRVGAEEVRIHDLVRGDIRFGAGMVGDFVLLRSDGFPTYNFACVVDDAAMEITHVVRGEDHLANTMRQQILYGALGMTPPAFAHVPLILGPDREKLSKRQGDASVSGLRARGFLPEAVVNHLALLGWSSEDGREKLTRDELVARFTIERVHRAAAVFDEAKLAWLNGLYVRELPIEDLYARTRAGLEASGFSDPVRAMAALRAVRTEIERLGDLPMLLAPLADDGLPENDEARAILREPGAREVLGSVLTALSEMDSWNAAACRDALTRAGRAAGAKGRALYMPVRVALTGRTHGPELPLVLEAMGRERVLERLGKASFAGA